MSDGWGTYLTEAAQHFGDVTMATIDEGMTRVMAVIGFAGAGLGSLLSGGESKSAVAYSSPSISSAAPQPIYAPSPSLADLGTLSPQVSLPMMARAQGRGISIS
jgi:hypothetical protein